MTMQPVAVVAIEKASQNNHAEKRANLFEFATFSWLDSLIWRGSRGRLVGSDIPILTKDDSTSSIVESLSTERAPQGIVWQLLQHLRAVLILQGLWAFIASISKYGPTVLLQSILAYIEDIERSSSTNQVWIYTGLMLASGLVYAVADGQTVWLGERIKLRVRSMLVSEIYAKIMRRNAFNSNNSSDNGTIINMISADTDKIADAGAKSYEIWASVPVRVTIALGLLYRLLGWSSFAGVTMMLATTPINSLLFKYMGRAITEASVTTDSRVQSTDELLRNIRMIKLFAWEEVFEKRLQNKRSKELHALRVRQFWWCIMATVWYIMPSLITFLAFFTYTAIQQQPLPPSTAFTALSLFNLLKSPLDQLVGMLSSIQESTISVSRLESFLGEIEIPNQEETKTTIQESTAPLGFENATLAYGSVPGNDTVTKKSSPLRNINIRFMPGRLNIVTGPTGGGKTSLLLGLLGEMNVLSGAVHTPNGAIAYCSQKAWLLNDTVKQNIVFTSTWDAARYETVLQACGLVPDLALLKDGDLTLAGEGGASLSGGQRQRVALARALYFDSTFVVLDDCLSAVDSRTAKWIFEKCLTGPLMTGRTCILATHSVALAMSHAAHITVIADGRVAASGSPVQLQGSKAFANLWETDVDREDAPKSENQEDPAVSESSNILADVEKRNVPNENLTNVGSDSPLHSVMHSGSTDSPAERPLESMSLPAIWSYAKAMGGPTFWILITSFFAGQQVAAIALNWWLREFANAYSSAAPSLEARRNGTGPTKMHRLSTSSTTPKVWYYLSVFSLILLLYTIVNFGRLYVASEGSLRASGQIHRQLLATILRAKFQFFDRTSHGTLLNCFSQDLSTVDHEVMPMALGTLHFLVMSLFIFSVMVYLTPSFFIPGLVIMGVYLTIGRVFLNTSQQLEHIRSHRRELLLQHVSKSLVGVVTIRAFEKGDQFAHAYYERIDGVNQLSLFVGAMDRWLTFRLNATGTIMSFVAGYFALSSIGKVSPGAIGLTLSYAITFSDNILWLVRYHALNQQNFTAVERIKDLYHAEPEASARTQSQHPDNWPAEGAILFQNYSTRYRDDLEPVLRRMNFEIHPYERIGVVGRTGAGKSSLALALLRALEATEGEILIDNVKISDIVLHDLRRAIAFVPQDPSLFAGDLRSNLDIFGEFSDSRIREVLTDVGLLSSGSPDEGENVKGNDTRDPNIFANLSMSIEGSGTNISLGQRQLLCLARALLRSPKIVIMDEATASIDHATDLKIQQSLSRLKATVITIAHRLRTIVDYDKVLMMDRGETQQFGHPWELLKQGGAFRDLCAKTGHLRKLEHLARAHWMIKETIPIQPRG